MLCVATPVQPRPLTENKKMHQAARATDRTVTTLAALRHPNSTCHATSIVLHDCQHLPLGFMMPLHPLVRAQTLSPTHHGSTHHDTSSSNVFENADYGMLRHVVSAHACCLCTKLNHGPHQTPARRRPQSTQRITVPDAKHFLEHRLPPVLSS